MITTIDWILGGVVAVFLLPASVLLTQVICALVPRRPAPPPRGARPRLAVLIPAHDESTGLLPTLASVSEQLDPGDRLLVVADNCSDDTARVAAGAGAEVVERRDLSRRGKGYALDFGVRHLERDPPGMVVVMDADCTAAAGTIDRIAKIAAATGRPVQALYLMQAPSASGPRAQIAAFAWVVRNLVRPLGFHRLGLPCQLMGTGMAFPWAAIRPAPLASGHIVEDLKLGAELARAGLPPLFCPEATVTSTFPASDAGTRSQRTRWEHGHLAMIAGEVPRLLLDGVRGKGAGLLALGLDMCVPPLALLTLISVALFAACGAWALATGSVVPLALATLLLSMLAAVVGLSWLGFGRAVVAPRALLLALGYALSKIPLYCGFVFRRQVEWVRSRRDTG